VARPRRALKVGDRVLAFGTYRGKLTAIAPEENTNGDGKRFYVRNGPFVYRCSEKEVERAS
jgi:hypothetical protein